MKFHVRIPDLNIVDSTSPTTARYGGTILADDQFERGLVGHFAHRTKMHTFEKDPRGWGFAAWFL